MPYETPTPRTPYETGVDCVNTTANKFVLVWALALTAFLVMGMTIPNSFVSGTTISAAQVNANFTAVKTAVDALESPTRRGTVLLAGKVSGSAGTFATGAYTSSGGVPVCVRSPIAAVGTYDISLPAGEVYDENKHAVFVTPNGSVARFSTVNVVTTSSPFFIRVRIFDSAANLADNDFQIIVFND